MSKKRALGRGLSALLSDTPEDEKLEVEVPHSLTASKPNTDSINEIPVEFIETNPFQPREHFDQEALNELAESIKVHGIIQPITVRRLAHNQYQLISGERRFQASKLAGLKQIPAYIRTANDQQMMEMALIENIQRENLNPIEISLSYQRLISECNLKQEELQKLMKAALEEMMAKRQQSGQARPGGGQTTAGPRPGMGMPGASGQQTQRRNPPKVWTLDEKGNLKIIFVRTGMTDTSYTEIVDGNLKEGDEVIVGIMTASSTGSGQSGQRPGGPAVFRF